MSKRKILITGKGSYVGTSFMKWVEQWPDQYEVLELSVRGAEWKEHDFSVYDVVLHVAGIAHVSTDPSMEQQYYKINRDLAIEVAEKAKKEYVKQFIFMSSMIIYGADGKIGEDKIITKDTKPNPIDFYGRSKLEADNVIQKLNSEDFKTVSVRTPMVYGPNCKGNFSKLKQLAKKCPLFPDIRNQRSMIFIDNLSEFLRLVINSESVGVFHPQNKEYICTTNIIKLMALEMGKKIMFLKIFNYALGIVSGKYKIINKVFGSKVYDKKLSNHFNWKYCVVGLNESIIKSLK
ncbi:NAD-dependent epimerase/dehydratase family protein [Acinetobacter sp. CUI P1]|nr:NAD-dependent epimerase/dehydratase family protein [Acinetobacter sp. CUI P1]